MVLHIGHQIREALTLMMTGAAIRHIAERALDRVGTRAIGRQPEQGHPRVTGEPLVNGLGLMNFIVIDHDIESRVLLGWIASFQGPEPVAEQGVGVVWSQAMEYSPSGQIERPSQVVLLM